MSKADLYYKENLKKILVDYNVDERPRPKYKDGKMAYSYFITQVFEEYDINKGEFPIPTLRNTAIKTGIKEILWIYQKQSNSLKIARKNGIKWWNDWDIGNGTIGQRYGATVKKWDLMNKLLTELENNPFSRRHIINLYQESDLKQTDGLYPCAFETLWSVRKSNGQFYLDLTLNQRSNDYIVSGYINKIQYVALQLMICGHLGYKPGKFCHFVQNLHIYNRHIEAANEILSNESMNIMPRIELNVNKNFYDITIDDFEIFDVKDIPKLKSSIELAI